VVDTGRGIPDEQKANLFQEFYRLDTTGSDRLGLGLAIVDGLATLLDHEVALASVPRRGTRFSITLPKGQRTDAPRGTEIAIDPIVGKRILVIDDDALMRESLCGLLNSWGCDAMAVETVDEARRASGSRVPDLVISDFRLSQGQTGLDSISVVRHVSDHDVPALLITAETAPDQLREAKQSGFPILHKPVTPMALRALVSRLLTPD
ncbi:MAG: response regulator, partial [Paracoccaceae bacterium]|nr:response regulator [Paracoccaceae bacterium]